MPGLHPRSVYRSRRTSRAARYPLEQRLKHPDEGEVLPRLPDWNQNLLTGNVDGNVWGPGTSA